MSQSADQRLLDALRLLLVPGVGPRIQQSLVDYFGSPGAVFKANGKQLAEVPGVGPKLNRELLNRDWIEAAQRQLAQCREAGVDLLRIEDDCYPRSLKEIHDAPQILYCRGTVEPRDDLSKGIECSRHCSVYGRQTAQRLASSLARAGMTIVSGLARGIDAAAHRGAMEVGGRTLAVLGTGVTNIYPPEHQDLAAQVTEHGALICLLYTSPSPRDRG